MSLEGELTLVQIILLGHELIPDGDSLFQKSRVFLELPFSSDFLPILSLSVPLGDCLSSTAVSFSLILVARVRFADVAVIEIVFANDLI